MPPHADRPFRGICLALVASLGACDAYDASLLDGVQRGGGTAGARGGARDAGAVARDAGRGAAGGPAVDAAAPDGFTGAPAASVCGDGVVADDEVCDTAIADGEPGACPEDCPSLGECLPRRLRGSGCYAWCEVVIPDCMSGDGCCPAECSHSHDADCSGSCGDGVLQPDEGESCEVASADAGAADFDLCPTECPDDGDACTVEMLTGSPDNCNSECAAAVIESLDDGDGCCPTGANSTLDDDCPVRCGNQVVEAGEDCDGGPNCDEQCKSTLPPEEQRCRAVFTGLSDSCRGCMCGSCTAIVNDCFDSGDAQRDADCAEVVHCGFAASCRGSQCYCGLDVGPDDTCVVGDGPCAAILDRIAGIPGALSVYTQQSDLTTAIGRARALTDCHGTSCLNECP